MKIPRFSHFAVAAVFAFGLTCPPVRAETPDDAKRHAAAEELLKIRKTEDLVNGTVTRMGEMTDRISDGAARQAGTGVDQKAFTEKLKTEARDMIRKEFSWDMLKPEFIQAYSQAFTEAELKELIAFYQTPTGKKLVATEPEIQGRLSKLSQEKAMSVMPRVVQHLRELVAATQPPGSAPVPLMPAPPNLPVPPSPPPGLMIPPPPPPGAVPSAPPSNTKPPTAPPPPPPATTTTAPPPPTMTPPPPPPNMTAPVPPPPATPPVAPSGTAAPSGTP